MRYISCQDVTLYDNCGSMIYHFYNGQLLVGDAGTNVGSGNAIVTDYPASGSEACCLKDCDLQRVMPFDLQGASIVSLELCGLGSLNSYDSAGAGLGNIYKGYQGLFYEAPIWEFTTSGDLVGTPYFAINGMCFKVINGSVTYNGVKYIGGESFCITGSVTTITINSTGFGSNANGTATISYDLPPALCGDCFHDSSCDFANKTLLTGNESTGYWNRYNGGFVPSNSLTSTDAEWFGWVE